jgi:hypothetical protein
MAAPRLPWLIRWVVGGEARAARRDPAAALREAFAAYNGAADVAALKRPEVRPPQLPPQLSGPHSASQAPPSAPPAAAALAALLRACACRWRVATRSGSATALGPPTPRHARPVCLSSLLRARRCRRRSWRACWSCTRGRRGRRRRCRVRTSCLRLGRGACPGRPAPVPCASGRSELSR